MSDENVKQPEAPQPPKAEPAPAETPAAAPAAAPAGAAAPPAPPAGAPSSTGAPAHSGGQGAPRRDGPGGGPRREGGPSGPRRDFRDKGAPPRGAGGPGGPRKGKRQYFRKRKVCKFCVEKSDWIDYKKADRLREFVQDRGKILPRRITGTCSRHQRWLHTAIMRARNIAMLPFGARS